MFQNRQARDCMKQMQCCSYVSVCEISICNNSTGRRRGSCKIGSHIKRNYVASRKQSSRVCRAFEQERTVEMNSALSVIETRKLTQLRLGGGHLHFAWRSHSIVPLLGNLLCVACLPVARGNCKGCVCMYVDDRRLETAGVRTLLYYLYSALLQQRGCGKAG